MSNKVNISIFGQGHLAIQLIEFIKNSKKFNLKNVICSENESIFDKSLEDWCRHKKIKFTKSLNKIKIGKNHVGISILYDKLIPEKVIKKFKIIFNCHYSLLPKFRGINPVHWAIKKKEKIGLTLHKVEPIIDTGQILQQFKTNKSFKSAFFATSFLNKKALIMIKNFLNKEIKKKKYLNNSQVEVTQKKNYFGKKDKFKLGKYLAFFQKKNRYNFYDGSNVKKSILLISNHDENNINYRPLKKEKTLQLKIGKKNYFYRNNFRVFSVEKPIELFKQIEKFIRNNVYFDIVYVHIKIDKKLKSLIKKISNKIIYKDSTEKKKIIFFTEADEKIGLGHFNRIYNLSVYLNQKNFFSPILVTNNNNFFRKLNKKKKIKIINIKNNSNKKLYEILKKNNSKILITDISYSKYLKKNSNYLKNFFFFFKKRDICTISFDDPFQNIFSNYSIIPYNIINFRNIKRYISSNNKKIFTGLKYLPILPIKTKNRKHKFKKKILILLSSFPKTGVLVKIMNIFKKLKNNQHYTFMIKSNKNLKQKNLLLKNFSKFKIKLFNQFISNKILFNWSDFVLFGSGMTKYEVMSAKKPGIMIHTLKRKKDYLILNFIKRYFKIIYHDKLSEKLEQEKLRKCLSEQQQIKTVKKLKKLDFSKNMQNIYEIIRDVNESINKNGIQRNI